MPKIKQVWSIVDFFNYNADRGGKRISIWIDGDIRQLTLSQLKKLSTFTLAGSDNQYKVIGLMVETL